MNSVRILMERADGSSCNILPVPDPVVRAKAVPGTWVALVRLSAENSISHSLVVDFLVNVAVRLRCKLLESMIGNVEVSVAPVNGVADGRFNCRLPVVVPVKLLRKAYWSTRIGAKAPVGEKVPSVSGDTPKKKNPFLSASYP